MARVLVTRAEDQAGETARLLRGMGHEPLLAPLGKVVALPCHLAGPTPACIAATSRNAFIALAVPEHWRSARVVAVGAATAEAARAAGFRTVEAADGDALSAARRILAGPRPQGPVVYLAGRPRKPDFESSMADAGVPLGVVETYRIDEIAALPPEVIAALQRGVVDVVLHYSAGSARRFATALAAAGLASVAGSIRHLVLSDDVAAVLVAARVPADRIAVAGKPDQASLLALLPDPA